MQTDKRPFEILVVDDEPPICEMMARIAQRDFPQARFINTRSAQETLAYLDEHANRLPKLILLDIDLHQPIDGLDLLPELRARLGTQIPIIMLSVLREEDKVEHAYQHGAVAYTQKPEDKHGWQRYVSLLRDYWYTSAQLPAKSIFSN